MVKHSRTGRQLLVALTIAAAGLAFASTASAEGAKPSRPNFVLIIGDDISVDDFGCYGEEKGTGAFIDALLGFA